MPGLGSPPAYWIAGVGLGIKFLKFLSICLKNKTAGIIYVVFEFCLKLTLRSNKIRLISSRLYS